MKYILLAFAMLTGISVFSQERYNLFLIGDRSFTGFTGDNSLNIVDQIYYLEEDSNNLCFYNHYLKFEFRNNSLNAKWFDEDEGTYKCEVVSKVRGQFYIIRFIVNEEPVYYYLYRRYDFLDKIWN